MTRTTFAYVPSSHLDLYWLGSYRTCLERGAHVIKDYLDRCLAHPEETFLLETVVFAEYFLEKHPDYRDLLLQLIREGRVEIGTVFVDRWEHLILGESHIRNIQIGARWSRDFLGDVNPLATHPDLPGLVAQTSQIYAQAGVEHYVTSRKLYENGAVWRHRAPDGTVLTYLNWPKHYIYYPLAAEDLPTPFEWIRSGLDVPATKQMFPLGTIPINAGAGDLTDSSDFRERYGAFLQDLIIANREKYPQYDFTFAIPSTVLEPYAGRDDIPELSGDIPSVWGVACDEEVVFFRRNRQSEYQLLAAETLAVVLEHLGLPAIPETEEPWQGRFYESAFYARKDPIATGQEFAELWKMHIFTEDHNGGGYEAALSTFQKRVMQDRVLAYTGQIISNGLAQLAGQLGTTGKGILAFNPLGQASDSTLTFDLPSADWDAGLRPVDTEGAVVPAQVVSSTGGTTTVAAVVEPVPSVGYRFLNLAEATAPSGTPSRATGDLTLSANGTTVTVDAATGAITALSSDGQDTNWGHEQFGTLRAIRESRNDVTLRIEDDAERVESRFLRAELAGEGPLFSTIRIDREILGNQVEQFVSLWHDGHVELETRIRWSGAHNWQVRLALPTASSTDDIAFGSPFYGSIWSDVTAEAYPRNGDELLVPDYHRYREVQEWLHLRQGNAGLQLVTTHPGFCFDDRGLEAVLLRTSPSCGDMRFFWENAGEQIYRIALYPVAGDWQAAGTIARAQRHLRRPVTALVEASGSGARDVAAGFLTVESDSALLSSLSRNVATGNVDLRVFEATGHDTTVTFGGELAAPALTPVDFIERETGEPVEGAIELPAWRIQTFTRK